MLTTRRGLSLDIYSDDDSKYGKDNEGDQDDLEDDEANACESSTKKSSAKVSRKKKKRRCYKPTVGSTIHAYMKDMCCRVRQNDPSLRLADGHYWVPPVNPISKTLGSRTEPDSYYLSNLWVYILTL